MPKKTTSTETNFSWHFSFQWWWAFFLSTLLLLLFHFVCFTLEFCCLQFACITNVNHISLDHLFMVLVLCVWVYFFSIHRHKCRTYLWCCLAWIWFVSDFQFPTTTKHYLSKCCEYRALDSILYSVNAMPVSDVCVCMLVHSM